MVIVLRRGIRTIDELSHSLSLTDRIGTSTGKDGDPPVVPGQRHLLSDLGQDMTKERNVGWIQGIQIVGFGCLVVQIERDANQGSDRRWCFGRRVQSRGSGEGRRR